jgi:hypothetical protein
MFWLIIKALLAVLPIIAQAVRDGRIKNGDKDEVLKEIEREHKRYVDAAAVARDRVVPDPTGRNPNQRD